MKRTIPKRLTHLFPSFGNVVWSAAFFAVVLRGRKMMNADGDLGRHLTIGRYMLDNFQIPRLDLFSHTMTGQILTPHEWLSQVLFALANQLLGFSGIVFLCALVIATSFWLVYRRTRLSSDNLIAFLVVCLAMMTSGLHWLTRPHIFTFLFLALWLFILEQMRLGKPNRWWLLPILMLFWANLHGAFIAGFVTWFIYGVGMGWDLLRQKGEERDGLPRTFWRDYFLGGGASFVVSFINPSGIDLWKTSVGYIGTGYLVDMTHEYQAPNFHLASTWPFLVFLLLLLLILAYDKKKVNSAHLFLTIAWAAMGLYSARNIPLFAIVASPLLASGMDDLLNGCAVRFKFAQRTLDMDRRVREVDSQLKGWLFPVLCIVVTITGLTTGFSLDINHEGYAFSSEIFPVEAADWLDENPQDGNVFNYFIWGGYLLFHDWPDTLVFIDGQTDFYGEELTRQYMQVLHSEEGWESVLKEYDVEWAILPVDAVAARMIQLELGWDIIYEDQTAVILHK